MHVFNVDEIDTCTQMTQINPCLFQASQHSTDLLFIIFISLG